MGITSVQVLFVLCLFTRGHRWVITDQPPTVLTQALELQAFKTERSRP